MSLASPENAAVLNAKLVELYQSCRWWIEWVDPDPFTLEERRLILEGKMDRHWFKKLEYGPFSFNDACAALKDMLASAASRECGMPLVAEVSCEGDEEFREREAL